MTAVMAIMMFLTVLAAAAGLSLSAGAARIEGQIGNRITVQIADEFITLGQVLKLANVVDDGAIAREVIQAGDVTLDAEVCTQRGRKVRPGQVVGTPVGEILVERG